MRTSAFSTLLILITAALQGTVALDTQRARSLVPRRTTSILNNPDAQPDLPTLKQAQKAAAAQGLDLDNIQGDVLVGMKKKKELFYFFHIDDVAAFKSKLASEIHPRITTTTELLSVALQPVTAVNIAFSQTGLNALGVTDDIGDFTFSQGQDAGASSLGDPGTSTWVDGLKGTNTHGVLILASDTVPNIDTELNAILGQLGASVTETHRLQGAARPGNQEGHEHFGYMDGISQPAVEGFTSSPLPGQKLVQPGLFLFGEEGDFSTHPEWAKDGTIMAFRQLQQKVPEFNKFLVDNPLTVPGLSTAENSELLGARMIGRWKSGAPIDLAPLADDTALAADPLRNNDFTYEHPGESLQSNQTRCPFSAHIRKTRPRHDFSPENSFNHIIRAGIPYGPELTEGEISAQASSEDPALERGLAFVSYQSNLNSGFVFMQQAWVNNAFFIFGKSDPTPGVDPIIGVDGTFGGPRVISGLDPLDPNHDITLNTDFIVPRGGEYFFVPPVNAILNVLAA